MGVINIPSEGCSKPRSDMARSSSCFNKKSLKCAGKKKAMPSARVLNNKKEWT